MSFQKCNYIGCNFFLHSCMPPCNGDVDYNKYFCLVRLHPCLLLFRSVHKVVPATAVRSGQHHASSSTLWHPVLPFVLSKLLCSEEEMDRIYTGFPTSGFIVKLGLQGGLSSI